jgi:hypothetical protein
MTSIESEGQWLVDLPVARKALFLTALMHALTIAGRGSYRPRTEELDKPAQLRAINEIQHRVSACLHQLLVGTGDSGFQQSIAGWVLGQGDDELRPLLVWAWRDAKARAGG